ncbi:excinuclease ABC subunit C [candidate division KSB1 bacterium]|nr:excinuclease ABC subunit C [candidate division KSB1 bacterium]
MIRNRFKFDHHMQEIPQNIAQKLANLSDKPGVYLFKDRRGDIIYIGKAKVLKNRVRSYFHRGRIYDIKLVRMVSRIEDIETIVTDSEVEALILEANLVKEYKPRYNINLKDDKSFPYIRVSDEPFPRIFPTRRLIRDGSRYFGPYTDVNGMRDVLKAIRRLFPVRSCKLKMTEQTVQKGKHIVCLDYHIHKCLGPCEGYISRTEYLDIIEYVVKFIQGHTSEIEKQLKIRITELAESLRFEEAARLRDQLKAVTNFQQRQKIVDQTRKDRDILAAASEDQDTCCVVFKVRDGKIIARQHFYLQNVRNENLDTVIAAFMKQYYLKADFIPAEIYLQVDLGEELQPLSEWLSMKRSSAVHIVQPQRGEKAQLLQMCIKNARLLLNELLIQKQKARDYVAGSITALQKDLSLKNPPKRIEAFDISNIQGADPVASMVCFVNGKPYKSAYRHYKIRSKKSPDDFAMMNEVVGRRYKRLINEKEPLPDLILIDGGKGQLSAALKALKELGIHEPSIAALAKKLDEVFVPGQKDPLNIRRDSAGLRVLQKVRDESHRFAISYHRKLRKKRTLISEIDKIPGIGPQRKTLLLKNFGSVTKIKQKSVEELSAIAGISTKTATQVFDYFHKER